MATEEEDTEMAMDEKYWEQWEHEALREAEREALPEAGREMARRAMALAWQAYLACKDPDMWPKEKTNRARVRDIWFQLDLAVLRLLGKMWDEPNELEGLEELEEPNEPGEGDSVGVGEVVGDGGE